MARRRGASLLLLAAVALPSSTDASLADSLHRFITENSTVFVGQAPDILTPFIERLATRGTALPATSTFPGFAYRFNLELGTFEREPGSLGPVFLERGETLGHSRLALGMSYLDADLTEFDGRNLADQIDFSSDVTSLEPRIRTSLAFQEFDIRAQIVSLSATYGITDRWDLNLLVPLVRTSLDLKARRSGRIGDHPPQVDTVRLHDEAFGVGDVQLRTKYQLVGRAPLYVAAGLGVRAPSGAEADFQGLGDWTVEPSLIASRAVRGHDLHLNLGVELDADDIRRSRGRYGVGAALQPLERIAVLIDVIGSSSFVADDLPATRAGTAGVFSSSSFLARFETRPRLRQPDGTTFLFPSVPRTDIVDLAVGLKLALPARGVAYVGVLIPIVKDALRAEVVPEGGVEFTF